MSDPQSGDSVMLAKETENLENEGTGTTRTKINSYTKLVVLRQKG